jgi:hypothetical protein
MFIKIYFSKFKNDEHQNKFHFFFFATTRAKKKKQIIQK